MLPVGSKAEPPAQAPLEDDSILVFICLMVSEKLVLVIFHFHLNVDRVDRPPKTVGVRAWPDCLPGSACVLSSVQI